MSSKAYWVNTFRSVRDPEKLARYAELAGPAMRRSGGRFLARGKAARAFELGVAERTVVIEFDSVEQAVATYESPAYQAALAVLGDGAERDLRIVEGIEAGTPPPDLEGELVRLRPAARSDIERLVEIRRKPEVYRHWRGGDDLVAAVEEDFAEVGVTRYVIELDGEVVGWIQWEAEEEPDYRHASMDIYVDPAVHGRGVGTDAVRTVARHLVVDHGHHRLTIDPAADNEAAIRCYTKVGFRPVGILRRSERGPDGTWHDGLLMDLLADELAT